MIVLIVAKNMSEGGEGEVGGVERGAERLLELVCREAEEAEELRAENEAARAGNEAARRELERVRRAVAQLHAELRGCEAELGRHQRATDAAVREEERATVAAEAFEAEAAVMRREIEGTNAAMGRLGARLGEAREALAEGPVRGGGGGERAELAARVSELKRLVGEREVMVGQVAGELETELEREGRLRKMMNVVARIIDGGCVEEEVADRGPGASEAAAAASCARCAGGAAERPTPKRREVLDHKRQSFSEVGGSEFAYRGGHREVARLEQRHLLKKDWLGRLRGVKHSELRTHVQPSPNAHTMVKAKVNVSASGKGVSATFYSLESKSVDPALGGLAGPDSPAARAITQRPKVRDTVWPPRTPMQELN